MAAVTSNSSPCLLNDLLPFVPARWQKKAPASDLIPLPLPAPVQVIQKPIQPAQVIEALPSSCSVITDCSFGPWVAKQKKKKNGRRVRKQFRAPMWVGEVEPLVSFPRPTAAKPGPEKLAVLAARLANRESFWDAADANARPIALEDAIGNLMKAWTHGIERLDDRVEHNNPWRVHPWDGTKHEHVGYFATWEEALLALRLWHAAMGTTDDESLNCGKWSPPDRLIARAATMTIRDIRRAARMPEFYRHSIKRRVSGVWEE